MFDYRRFKCELSWRVTQIHSQTCICWCECHFPVTLFTILGKTIMNHPPNDHEWVVWLPFPKWVVYDFVWPCSHHILLAIYWPYFSSHLDRKDPGPFPGALIRDGLFYLWLAPWLNCARQGNLPCPPMVQNLGSQVRLNNIDILRSEKKHGFCMWSWWVRDIQILIDFERLYPLSPRLIDKNQVGRASNAPFHILRLLGSLKWIPRLPLQVFHEISKNHPVARFILWDPPGCVWTWDSPNSNSSHDFPIFFSWPTALGIC